MFSEEKRLQKLDNAFLRITIFVTYFRKSVTYVLTFMDRQSFALVRKIFGGFRFYFISKFTMVKFNFFCNAESIVSEKTHFLEKHSKTDIGRMETVSVVRDIRCFMEVKDFRKMNFFHMKNILKKRASKNSKESNVWFFLPSTTYYLWFLPWLKLDLQTCNSQRLASVTQSTNKFHYLSHLSHFPCILNIHLEKLTGHVWFPYIFNISWKKVVRHVRWLDFIWTFGHTIIIIIIVIIIIISLFEFG